MTLAFQYKCNKCSQYYGEYETNEEYHILQFITHEVCPE